MMSEIKILIVENNRLEADDIRASLLEKGYQVVGIASTGPKAIEQDELQQPDVIIMDIELDGPISGIETAQRIQDKRDIPILFLTSKTDAETIGAADVVDFPTTLPNPLTARNLA